MFDIVTKKLGFGGMRLPVKNDKIDYEEMNKMVDIFMENGFNYFDTAHGYHNGASEIAFRECLVKRYKRDSFILVNKLTGSFFNSNEEIRPFFNKQLKDCGVEYFDLYLMHAQTLELFKKFKKCKAYEEAFKLKKEGKVKRVGLSFHDSAEVLDQMLTEYPEIEVVQIQLNYVDYNDPVVQAKKCHEVCLKHNKPIVIMEPVKGGSLAKLPSDAEEFIKDLNGGSPASYAIRYTAGFKNVFMVLSGMSNVEQVLDNISFMKDFKPLNDKEMQAISKVSAVFKAYNQIPCTACKYCVAGCPKNIQIPELFSCVNSKNMYPTWNNAVFYYHEAIIKNSGKASDCIGCGKCVKACPQHLNVPELLKRVTKEFENR